ncbi:1-acylglycerol-3-phosphate O-acyltransferase 6 (lysophosphatidic acid acyltransferase, zeta) [Apophysomyces ossiformis]|uniref:1-acylglycerol-3-phosphate O-acyltransferase 6 (Lysophosphatidic acid acyltransferase, zeta) n=1 Tax=Apophysomyces ossiformis TaxID=679940 RepID=A0A8H7BVI3_9FUNG|nr:1-acylglycerol-3-phosphate O-acyltransferase 6 (lysophosphatidic acid acyltransferase, zeta) [Apophysomyces ossiformis]
MVSTLVKYYCKGILFSLGTNVQYHGAKPQLEEPHVFVANHTSYLDYILVSAHKFPNAVVMARHGGALGFLQNYGLNFLNSMTFDRANTEERKALAARLKKHVMNPVSWPNPMILFPEGTCVNNKYAIRFQKGAFELGVKVCPVGIKYDRYWGEPYWDTRKVNGEALYIPGHRILIRFDSQGFLYYAFYRMTRWVTPVDVYYNPPVDPYPHEDAVEYGERVKRMIASSADLEIENFNGMAKRDLLKVLYEVKA